MKSLASFAVAVTVIMLSCLSAEGGIFFHRGGRGCGGGNSGTQGCAPAATQSCAPATTTFSCTPSTLPVSPTATAFPHTAKHAEDTAAKLAAFAQSAKCPPKAKAVIEAHLAIKTATRGAINWAALLADIEAAAPEVLALINDIISGGLVTPATP
jgi:hypothetical protein